MVGEAFTWGAGGAKLTPEQLAIARQLLARKNAQGVDTSPVGHWAQGAARIVDALGDVFQKNRLDSQEKDTAAYNTGLVEGLLGGQSVTPSSAAAAIQPTVAQSPSESPAPTIDISGDKQTFINALLPAAIQEGQRTGVDPRIIVAQAAHETGWGRSAPGNNYFGIKSHGQSGGQNLTTHEVVNGQRVKINDSFRTFGSPEESVRGYGDFILNNKRYQPLREAQGLDNQLAALQASGYATDPNYSQSVGAIARSINLPAVQAIEAQAPSSGYVDPMVSVQPQAMEPALPAPTNVASAPVVSAAAPASPPPQALAQALRVMADPRASEGTRVVAQAVMQQQAAAQERALAEQKAAQALAQRQSVAQSLGINPMLASDENAWKSAVEAANRGRQTTTVNGTVIDVNTAQPIFQATQQPTTGMQDYNFYAESERQAGRQPLGPLEYEQALRSAGASRTNIDTGTVPQGYQAIRDEQGRLVRYDPVPGGPADTTKTQAKAAVNTQRSGNIVLEDVDRAVNAIESNPSLTTGIIGNWSRGIGGTPANKVQNLLQTIRANSAFDRLQQMREASPTGGALGAVSDSELGLLQNAIGSLEQSNDSEDLVYNLRRVQRIYEDIINGPEAAAKIREERSKAGNSSSQTAQGWKDLGNGVKIRPKGSN